MRRFCVALRIEVFTVYSFKSVNCMEASRKVSLVRDIGSLTKVMASTLFIF